jgi:hypothetical protein
MCERARSYLKVERLVDFAEPALAQQIEEKVAVVQYWVRAEAGVVLVADSLQLPEVELLVEEKIAVLFLEVGFLLFLALVGVVSVSWSHKNTDPPPPPAPELATYLLQAL